MNYESLMPKVYISGYGRMGKMIETVLNEKGIACAGKSDDVRSVDRELAKECVCVDFSVPEAFRANYDLIPAVSAAFSAKKTPLIWASNFSIGVNVFAAAVDLVSRNLAKAGGYAPYIVEKHHCHKLDAPSGTAKTLAADIEKNMGCAPDVASVRVGELPGIHTVGFEGEVDRITMEHEAFSRKGFAEGAVMAAWMAEGLVGDDSEKFVYEFKDLLLG